MTVIRQGCKRLGPAAAMLALAGWLGLGPAPAPAYEPDGESGALGAENTEVLPVDVVVRVINGTTHKPDRAQTVTLQEIGAMTPVVASARDVAGEVVFQRLFLDETRSYLVQVVNADVPYFARTTGHDLAAGPVTVYVFETTTEKTGLAINELTVNVKRAEKQLQLEYLIAILNEASPQRTVLPDPTSLELMLPEGAIGAACEVITGALPSSTAPIVGAKPERYGLAVPLRSGTTRLRVTTSLPYDGWAQLRLETNLPVRQLSVNVMPVDLQVTGDFSDEGVDAETGWRGLSGPSLAADEELSWTVSGGSAPVIDTHGGGTLAGAPARRLERVKRTGISLVGWLVIIAALVMALLALINASRRGNAGQDIERDDDTPRPRRRRRRE